MFGRSYKLTRIRGIPIGLSPSLLIILLLMLVYMTDSYEQVTGKQETAFLLAGATAVLFYVSILLHELGHAVVAQRNDIEITGIDLWMFGGIAKMARDTTSPGVEFRIAAAGPAVTLLIVLVLAAGGLIGYGDKFLDLLSVSNLRTGESGLMALVGYLASINLLLLLFNLVPAFPLDGGRIARSIAWKLTGDRARGTRVAGALGQAFSVIMIGLAVYFVVKGDWVSGLWFGFIGFFIGDAARSAVSQTDVLSKIEGVRVEDVMDREPVAIPGTMTIADAMHEYFLRYRYPWFPVIDEHGRYQGVVEAERAQHVPEEKQKVFKINEILRAEGEQLRIGSDRLLEELLSSEALRRLGALVAVDGDGHLKGIVTTDQIVRALQHGAAR